MIRIEFEAPDTKGLGAEALRLAVAQVRNNLMAATLELLNSFKRTVGGKGKGRFYRRGKGGRMHQASLPGEPPARDRGDFVNSFDFGISETPDELHGDVGSRIWETRGKWLEFGTRRMRPRPFVDRAINAVRDKVERLLAR